MKIGSFDIENGACLAPMAGVTDVVYRSICKKYGAVLTCTEMVSTAGLFYSPKLSRALITMEKGTSPHVIQIFGADPKMMSHMAKKYCMNYDIIDINMGCPTPKIVKGGAGSALMMKADIAADIIKSVKDETGKIITCKIRSGWDDDNINAIEFAQKMQRAGASLITLHARTKKQYYTGSADWELIKKLKKQIDIPVIGNGDIKTPFDAKKMLESTKCDGIMVGRAAQGRPYLFEQIKTYLNTGTLIPKPNTNNIMKDALNHALGLADIYGQYHAAMMMRKHLAWYIKGEKNASRLRNEAVNVKNIDDINLFIQRICSRNKY